MTPHRIIPLATLTPYPRARPAAVTLAVDPSGDTVVRLEDIGSYQPLLDGAAFLSPAEAAEALAERYPAPGQLAWDDLGTAYTTALSDGCRDDPVTWVVGQTQGYLVLDLPSVRVMVWVGAAAAGVSRAVADWLGQALPEQPVRRRAGGDPESCEVVVGALHAW
ncbi:hypothetical protein [Lamprocystis purpurea]|jgi:hypothetical protein|uniref:hypothetical protein n=1 Tax=Lamprocystis purpurea TaxID=61598 RepID=UPI0003664513|nr:hypothetical protein [Lamprocystis purpurea]